MTESDELVWFEADGTRHVLGEPLSGVTDDVAEIEAMASLVDQAPGGTPTTEERAAERTAPATGERAAEKTAEEPATGERAAEKTAEEPATGERAGDESEEEPSALRGMVRALALGAAAAAATGARPDTTDGTVPSTEIALEEPAEPE